MELYSVIRTNGDASAARDARIFIDLANSAGRRDGILRENRCRPAGGSVRLADRFRYMLRIVRCPAQENAVRGRVNRSQLHVGFLEEAIRVKWNFE